MKKLSLITLLLVLLAIGCQKEELEVENIYIDEALAPYLERFSVEGAARGVTVDFESANISAYLENIPAAGVSGQCYHNNDAPNRLVIDVVFWNQASDIRREFVIFHELGHCFLQRSHLETMRSDGTCASMMHSGLSGCRNAYSSATRATYLDELFLEE